MATIAAHIITDFPEFYAYYSIRQYTYNRIKQDNRNLLLGRDPTVDGMKTGYTDAAGYCLVARRSASSRNAQRQAAGCSAWCWARRRARRAPARARSC